MSILLVRPNPIKNESSVGFLLRVCETNGFASLADFDALAGLAGAGTRGLTFVQNALSNELVRGKIRGPLLRLRHLKDADPGHLELRYWNGSHPRFCPACLAESAHWRALWDLLLVVACPVHKVQLLQACPSCGQTLSWRRRKVSICDCGHELATSPTTPATAGCLAISAHLLGKLGSGEIDPVAELPHLNDMDLADLLTLIALLGGYARNKARKPAKIAGLHDIHTATRIVEAAADVLAAWPNGYHNFMRLIDLKASTPTAGNRLAKRFGYFYTALYKTHKTPAFDFLRSGFELFLRKEWSGQLAGRNRYMSQSTLSEHGWISITEAAKALGVKPVAVFSYIESGTLVGHWHATAKGRRSGTVAKESLRQLVSERANLVTFTDARRLLKISRKRAEAMRAAGTLKPVSGPTVDGRPIWRFRADHIATIAVKRNTI